MSKFILVFLTCAIVKEIYGFDVDPSLQNGGNCDQTTTTTPSDPVVVETEKPYNGCSVDIRLKPMLEVKLNCNKTTPTTTPDPILIQVLEWGKGDKYEKCVKANSNRDPRDIYFICNQFKKQ
ncbi:unnamed protein product [Caenorhabditis angaria]|uniref:Uncharacterized protein n=1 Tax=Caenorhabditis angaria TaxID=860376 RepID=A0A9P1IED9_9PELO|nr:unnamed protein product [Caenorhabditis angaria]